MKTPASNVAGFGQNTHPQNTGLKTLSLDQQDEINTLLSCLSAVAELMAPAKDLQPVNRENLTTLLFYLTEADPKRLPESCLTAVLDLINPHHDLGYVSKEGLSCLSTYPTGLKLPSWGRYEH